MAKVYRKLGATKLSNLESQDSEMNGPVPYIGHIKSEEENMKLHGANLANFDERPQNKEQEVLNEIATTGSAPKYTTASGIHEKENKTGMPDATKNQMEEAFQSDFSNIKIRKNSQKAQELGVKAFTQGNQVHFNKNQFDPDSSGGKKLLSHELTHVLQQRKGKVKPDFMLSGMPVNRQPGLEEEANKGLLSNNQHQYWASETNASAFAPVQMEAYDLLQGEISHLKSFASQLSGLDPNLATRINGLISTGKASLTEIEDIAGMVTDITLKEKEIPAKKKKFGIPIPGTGKKKRKTPDQQAVMNILPALQNHLHGIEQRLRSESRQSDASSETSFPSARSGASGGSHKAFQPNEGFMQLSAPLGGKTSRPATAQSRFASLLPNFAEEDVFGSSDDEQEEETPAKETTIEAEAKKLKSEEIRTKFQKAFADTFISDKGRYKTVDKTYDSELRGETTDPFGIGAKKVEYLSEEKRKPYEVTISGGVMKKELKQESANFIMSSHAFILSPNNKMYVGRHETGEFHHSSFLGGGKVKAAGMITVKDGKIIKFSNKSGHYKPGKIETLKFMMYLKSKGVDLAELDYQENSKWYNAANYFQKWGAVEETDRITPGK